jgi:SAM-dependent methyltransferase
MLVQADRNAREESLNGFQLIRADICRQPFAEGSLDGAHAGAALHLWPDVPGALAEIARKLRPGGPFVASTFFTVNNRLLRLGQRVAGRGITTQFFDEDRLCELFRRAGFADIRVKRRASLGLISAVKVVNSAVQK